MANETFLVETLRPEIARLTYGRVLKDILVRFRNKTERILVPDRMVHVYSGHDATIAGLLNTMGLFEVSRRQSLETSS